jgi:MSHA biogenesis protein MshQ
MSAPGAANTGYVDIAVDLSAATGANLEWLRYDWPHDGNMDDSLDDEPLCRVTFGIYPGSDPVIYLREIY